MKDFINNIVASLDNHTKGFSARKLSALAVMICIVVSHIKWWSLGDLSMLGEILIVDYGFIALCLGMTTYEAIKNKSL